jgi:aspartate/glutamate racemase
VSDAATSALERDVARVCLGRLKASACPWTLRPNYNDTPAHGCRQAARVRDRLGSGGHGGIPLWAELKSVAGVAVPDDGSAFIPFAAHTRANTTIDWPALLRALDLDPARAAVRSFVDDDAEYADHPLAEIVRETRLRWRGLINPFTVDLALSDYEDVDLTLSEIVQIFDSSVTEFGGLPDTLMTNVGDRLTAMEVAPRDLVCAVRQLSGTVTVTDVAVPCPIWRGEAGDYQKDFFLRVPPPTGPRVGILTGNGPESGVALLSAFVAAVRAPYQGGVPDVFMPEIVLHSTPGLGLSMELVAREREVEQQVTRGVSELLLAGCKLITVACNTTIYFEPALRTLCESRGARFVSIAEATVPAVVRALQKTDGGSAVGLIGIGSVIDLHGGFSGYSEWFAEAGLTVRTCAADAFAFAIKNRPGVGSRVSEFAKLVTALPEDTAVVVLALTEASLVYADYEPRKQGRGDERIYVDGLRELGKYLAFEFLLSGYRESAVCQLENHAPLEPKLRELLGWSDPTGTEDA